MSKLDVNQLKTFSKGKKQDLLYLAFHFLSILSMGKY